MFDDPALLRQLAVDDDLDLGAIDRTRTALARLIEAADGPGSVVPYLIYADVGRALDWLVRAFGFAERTGMRLSEPDGTISHAELELSGARIVLGPPSIHGDAPSRGVSLLVSASVDDVTAHYRRAVAAGATVVRPLTTSASGGRYQVADPEGHQWRFQQDR